VKTGTQKKPDENRYTHQKGCVYMNMEQWARVRRKVLVEKQSKRSVMLEEGLHWETLQKMLSHPQPPDYERNVNPERKIDPHRKWIHAVLDADREIPRKQRHTAKRLFDRLKIERGYAGGYTVVKEVVAELKAMKREVFVPLSHPPGEAQVDFGHALVKLNGILTKCPFFVMSLPYSDAFYVQVFARECTETFWEGHVRAFAYFGAVPSRISYDNSSIAVSRMLIGRQRKLTDGFLQLQSHYLFQEHFCLAARGNEKGVVESIVRYSRSNFLVPVPQVNSLEELNATLETACREDLKRQLRGKAQRKAALLSEDRLPMLELPDAPFDACRILCTRANSLSLVRFDNNDYSVPVRCAHRPVVIKGSCDNVCIYHDHTLVAEHSRTWEKEKVRFDPVHYLALLERKPGALDFARPLEGWQLPDCLHRLRKSLEAGHGHEGTKEYIGVLRLLEKHSLSKLKAAVETALTMGCPRKALIEQCLYSEDREVDVFHLDGRDHLKGIKVATTDPSAYTVLLQHTNEAKEEGIA
jgi:transposase